MNNKKKQSLYFPADMLHEIMSEAARLDRSPSWVVQRAWRTARRSIMSVPTVPDGDSRADGDGRPT
jgi:uncharacterized small protein (TIGR04563 family)